jgi:hypothetical protein
MSEEAMNFKRISKTLSANDVGETGSHQAGILVPKDDNILSFFPTLRKDIKNPRANIPFFDDAGYRWVFSFIYYNNKLFGGTRNEYRLTRMTKYIRSNSLKTDDEIYLSHNLETEKYSITFQRKDSTIDEDGVLRIGSSWKIINI